MKFKAIYEKQYFNCMVSFSDKDELTPIDVKTSKAV